MRWSNSRDSSSSVVDEVLQNAFELYAQSNYGLVDIGHEVGIQLEPPRKKIVISLIGNHSVGKSAFINWYTKTDSKVLNDETDAGVQNSTKDVVLNENVAINTPRITVVTKGASRETLIGRTTMHAFPLFRPLKQIQGVDNFLRTELITSDARLFPSVTFIETPGLVCGEMNYHQDIDKAVEYLGTKSDLVLVFFDPIGKSLGEREMKIVEKIHNNINPQFMHFYLTKSDEVPDVNDQKRVLIQIAQGLCVRPGLNRVGLKIPPISVKPEIPDNCITEVTSMIEWRVKLHVQHVLKNLEDDCKTIANTLETKIEQYKKLSAHNTAILKRSVKVSFVGMLLPLLLLSSLVVSAYGVHKLPQLIGYEAADWVSFLMTPFDLVWLYVEPEFLMHGIGGLVTILSLSYLLISWQIRKRNNISCCQIRKLNGFKKVVANNLNKKNSLFQKFLTPHLDIHELSQAAVQRNWGDTKPLEH